MVGYQMVENVLRYRFNRLDTIPACDRQTDRRTRCRSKDRAMLCVARV